MAPCEDRPIEASVHFGAEQAAPPAFEPCLCMLQHGFVGCGIPKCTACVLRMCAICLRVKGMLLKDAINKDGFRHWYEGELIRAFGYVALGLLLFIFGASALEIFWERSDEHWVWSALKLVGAFAGVILGGLSWIRFSRLIARAEILAHQAVCPSCKVYGRLQVDDERSDPETLDRVLQCRCNKCHNLWAIYF